MKKQTLTLLFAAFALPPAFYITNILVDADTVTTLLAGAIVLVALTYLLVLTFYKDAGQSVLKQFAFHFLASVAGVLVYGVVVNAIISQTAVARVH